MLESKQKQGGESESGTLGSTCTDLALVHGIPLLPLRSQEQRRHMKPHWCMVIGEGEGV